MKILRVRLLPWYLPCLCRSWQCHPPFELKKGIANRAKRHSNKEERVELICVSCGVSITELIPQSMQCNHSGCELMHHVIDILTPSSLFFEIRHVGRGHGESIEFESTQCRYFSPVIVLDKDRDGLDALVVNELQQQIVGVFLQILRG